MTLHILRQQAPAADKSVKSVLEQAASGRGLGRSNSEAREGRSAAEVSGSDSSLLQEFSVRHLPGYAHVYMQGVPMCFTEQCAAGRWEGR